MIAVFITVGGLIFCLGVIVGLSINGHKINKTIKEAKRQMEISKSVIEQNKMIIKSFKQ